jgi:hypothetical protein
MQKNRKNIMNRLEGAYSLNPDGDVLLRDAFGINKPWDSYFVDCGPAFFSKVTREEMGFFVNLSIYDTYYKDPEANRFDVTPESTRFGRLFLENLPLVRVMLTNAEKDLIIYPPAIPPSFVGYKSLVSNVEIKPANPDVSCSNRKPKCDAKIIVSYKDSSSKQSISFPYYSKAGHAVSWLEGEKLFKDVRSWMNPN